MKKNTCKSCKYAQPPKPGFPDKVYCGYYLLHMSSFSETECCHFDREIETNYDRLVSVSRAELAHFMMRTTDCPCIAKETGCCRSDISCQKAWLDWLNKEAPHEP